MDDKQLDRLFREKLESHTAPVDGSSDLWDSIASSLDKEVDVRGGMRRKIFYSVASVAAIIAAAYFLFAPNSQKPYTKEINEISVLAQHVEQMPNETQPKFQPIEKKQDNVVAALTLTQTLTIKTSINQAKNSVTDSLYVAEVGDYNDNSKEVVKDAAHIRVIRDIDDLEEEYTAKNRASKISLALASNIISGNNIDASPKALRNTMMSGSNYTRPEGIPSIDQVSETKYSLPLNLGLQIQIKVTPFLSVGVGMNYSMLGSKYDGLIDKKMHSVKQTLHYIGIPVNIYGNLLQKKDFSLYANLGGSIEKGVNASYSIKSYDQKREYSSSIDGMQYSLNFGLGVEYRFIKQIGIYLEPNAVYFFNSKIPNSIRTDQPFQLKAEIGFRFHL